MSKLTVAEASKRGYATGLSILQAVQKDWLTVEKADDGQLLVDTSDLEKLFGLPEGAAKSPIVSSDPVVEFEDEAPLRIGDALAEPETDFPSDGSFTTDADSEIRDMPLGDTVPIIEHSAPPALSADFVPPVDTADRADLLAKIASLEAELDKNQKHVAALLDVLSTHAPATPDMQIDGPAAPDTQTEEPAVPDTQTDEPAPAAHAHVDEFSDTVATEDDAPEDAPEDDAPEEQFTDDDRLVGIPPYDEDRPEKFPYPIVPRADFAAGDIPDSALPDIVASEFVTSDSAPPVPADADADAVAPAEFRIEPDLAPPDSHEPVTAEPQDDARHEFDKDPGAFDPDDDITVPVFAAETAARPAALAAARSSLELHTQDEPESGGFFWRLWLLMSFVWVAMFGAFYWFVYDLQADLKTTAEWIRGSLAIDSPNMIAAISALEFAARDILAPPALLFITMFVLRLLYRRIRH